MAAISKIRFKRNDNFSKYQERLKKRLHCKKTPSSGHFKKCNDVINIQQTGTWYGMIGGAHLKPATHSA